MGRPTHRMTGTPEHRAYWNMIGRCEDPSVDNFPAYGGRGISVCAAWRANFATFLADMGLRPSPLHSIDRIDVNGNYEPGNVRWALLPEQANNRRSNIRVTVDGVSLTVAQWATRNGINAFTIYKRIRKQGWDPAIAVTKPRGPQGAKRHT